MALIHSFETVFFSASLIVQTKRNGNCVLYYRAFRYSITIHRFQGEIRLYSEIIIKIFLERLFSNKLFLYDDVGEIVESLKLLAH